MQRKIIQQSATSMGVSLPAKWVKKWNLKKGDAVNIEESHGLLEIKPIHFAAPVKRAEIDASLYGKLTRRKFDNLSKKGYDEIKVYYKNEKDLKPIRETLMVEAVMFEIVKKEKDYILLKAISEINKEELDNLLNRLVFLIREKINKIHQYFQKDDEQLLQDIFELEKANNKIAHICMRILHKQPSKEDSYIKYTFIWQLEKLGNDFKFFAKTKPKNTRKETKKEFNLVLKNLSSITELYFKYDSEKAIAIYDQRNKISDNIINLLKEKNNVNDHPLLHIALSMSEKSLYLLGLLFASVNNNQV